MKNFKIRFNIISNIIFIFFASLLLSLIWLNYYIKNLKISFTLSLLLATITDIIYFLIILKKENKNIKLKKIENKKNNLKNILLFSKNEDIIKIIAKIYNFNSLKKIKSNHYLNENSDIFLSLDSNIIDNNQLIKFIKESKNKQIFIFCIENNSSINLKNFIIKFEDFENIYKKVEIYNPNIENKFEIIEKNKTNINDVLNVIFSKNKSKNYFYLSLLLLISSLITVYKIYYIISSTILIILSIYSRFNKKFNKKIAK